ncbi:MAG: DUF1566 domain-containing protein [Agitococcus sp.]|nr:DUF1566 domain-containing protein [Agitococcus sp.]
MGNRHDVYIWDADVYGKPTDFEDAMDMAPRLAKQRIETQTANMLAFGQTVEKLLKTYDEDEQQELFLEGTAADIADTHKAAYNMEISEIGLWPLLLKILLDAAKEHSVVIFDQEAWIACVSPNTILPESAEIEWQRTVEKFTTHKFPKTPKQMKKHFEPLLTNLLVPHGFRRVADPDGLVKFQRDTPFMSQILELGADWYRDNIEVIVLFRGESKSIAALEKKLATDDSRYLVSQEYIKHDVSTIIWGDLFGPLTHEFKTHARHDLYIIQSELDVIRVLNLIKNIVIPIFDHTIDLQSTYIALSTDKFPLLWRRNVFCWWGRSLAIARLINPQKEDFEQAIADYLKFNSEVALNPEWTPLIDGLRQFDVEEFFAEKKRYQQSIQEHLDKKTPSQLMDLGEWYDKKSNLIWQRYCLGQEWQNGSVSGQGSQMTWTKAIELTTQREVKDFGWRLPTEKELASLMLPDKAGYKTEQGILFCPKEEGQYATFWTSTTQKNSEEASVVVFYEGKVRKYPKGYGCFVRLVRKAKGSVITT